MAGQEPNNLPDTLQLRDMDVQVRPLDGLDLKRHVLGEDVSSTTRPGHVSAGWGEAP